MTTDKTSPFYGMHYYAFRPESDNGPTMAQQYAKKFDLIFAYSDVIDCLSRDTDIAIERLLGCAMKQSIDINHPTYSETDTPVYQARPSFHFIDRSVWIICKEKQEDGTYRLKSWNRALKYPEQYLSYDRTT